MVVNSLMKLGAEVYHEQTKDIHVSGHASAEELKLMITITKPRYFMPIHGEFKHLKAHSDIAESLNIKSANIIIPENRDILELSKRISGASAGSAFPIYVDGNDIGNIDSSLIRERQIMSAEGALFVSAVVSQGLLVSKPDISSRGFLGNRGEEIAESLKKDLEERLHKHLESGHSIQEIKASLKKSMKNSVFKLTHRNPLIVIQIIEV